MKKHAHSCALFGAVSQLLIPIGLVVSMFRLQAAASGLRLAQATELRQITSSLSSATTQMAEAFDYHLATLGLAMVGLVFFIIAITRFKYRRPWAFWFSCVHGALLICLFPLGLPLGLFLLIYALIHRQEFLSNSHLPNAPGSLPAI